MSKIYEALLRAEQEKTLRGVLTEEPLESAIESMKFGKAGPSPIAQAEPSGRVLREADLIETTPHSSRDFDALAVHVWQPDLGRLPAAEARGGKIEQFRSLRSKLSGLRHVQHLKSICVSSGHAGEGKSFVASNLALTLARHKATRVLLVDGDMRRGTLHKVLGTPNEQGLAECLSGKADLARVLQKGEAPQGAEPLPAAVANLIFCPCGHAGDRAAELSGSSRFGEFLRKAAELVDWVIVDSSPVNVVSDGVNLARACDSTLLVVRGGETKFETAQRALRELKAAKMLGVVLNAVSEFAPNEGNYGYQGYESLDG